MIKNVEQIDEAYLGFMMPLGTSSNYHKAYFSDTYVYMQNQDGVIYQFEDDDFSGLLTAVQKKRIDNWVKEIQLKKDAEF